MSVTEARHAFLEAEEYEIRIEPLVVTDDGQSVLNYKGSIHAKGIETGGWVSQYYNSVERVIDDLRQKLNREVEAWELEKTMKPQVISFKRDEIVVKKKHK